MNHKRIETQIRAHIKIWIQYIGFQILLLQWSQNKIYLGIYKKRLSVSVPTWPYLTFFYTASGTPSVLAPEPNQPNR